MAVMEICILHQIPHMDYFPKLSYILLAQFVGKCRSIFPKWSILVLKLFFMVNLLGVNFETNQIEAILDLIYVSFPFLVGGCKYFLFLPPTWGNDKI